MVRRSGNSLRFLAMLLGAGIFVSGAFGQAAQKNSKQAALQKSNVSENTNAKTPKTAVTNEPKTQGTDSIAQKTTAPATVITTVDSSAIKQAAITPVAPDSSAAKKDSSAIQTAASNTDSTAVVTPDSSIAKKDSAIQTAAPSTDSTAVDSSAMKQTAITSTAPDSSKAKKDSITAIQAASNAKAAADSAKSKKLAEKKKSRDEDAHKNTGLGIVLLAGTAGPELGLIGSLHQFMHCRMPINIRALFSFLPVKTNFDQTISEQKLGIGLNSRVSSADVFLDFHPFKNWFRFSTGAFFSFSQTKVKMQSKDGKSINMITITPEEMGSLEFTFKRIPVEPYLGIGLGNTLGHRVSYLMDLGVAYTGPVKVKATGTGMIASSADNAQNLQSVFDKHPELFFWPVVSFGIGVNLF
jgi:hypothetical protein